MKPNEMTVTLTADERLKLSMYLMITEDYRQGRLRAWEDMQLEKNLDGSPKFEKAAGNAAFWRDMIQVLEQIREKIDY